jgi:phenylalanine-4-hydroxylase
MPLQNSTKQSYESYTEADHRMWGSLYDRQLALVRKHACREYLDGLDRLRLPEQRVANLDALNECVRQFTSWQFMPAPGALSTAVFFRCLDARRFPIAVTMRRPHEKDFAELPDLFHDLFGHGPTIVNPITSRLYEQFGSLAMHHIDDNGLLSRLAKLFWFTMEVGLVRQDGGLKAYGGAILSSFGEMTNILESGARRRPLHPDDLGRAPYEFRELQKEYFVTESFEALADTLERLDKEAL